MPNPKIVKFNVGGTRYDVSQSLLDRFPFCMLSKICSDTWQQQEDERVEAGSKRKQRKESEPIFIDRNGQRFQYVLDFMRDGRVELPMSIPRGHFVRDMEYFGLDYKDTQIVLSVADPSDLFHSLGRYRDYFAAKSAEIDQRLDQLRSEKLACDVAKEFFSQLQQKKDDPMNMHGLGYHHQHHYGGRSTNQNVQKGIKFFSPTSIVVPSPGGPGGFGVQSIQKHLNEFGLKAESVSPTYSGKSEISVLVSLMSQSSLRV